MSDFHPYLAVQRATIEVRKGRSAIAMEDINTLVIKSLRQGRLAASLADRVLPRQDDKMKASILALLLGTAFPLTLPVQAAIVSAAGSGHVPTGTWVVDYENDFCSLDRGA